METQSAFSCFLVKVASRCNLDCDYCYMYHHADQSWKKMPAFLSAENEDLLAFRIGEYAKQSKMSRCVVVYHGGEPLLAGIETIERITAKIKNAVPVQTAIDFSLQTNGTLITEEILGRLETLNVSVSLSIDGPREIQDKHRLNHAGKSSFEKTENALKLLLQKPQVFSGVIAVIDPLYPPDLLLKYFDAFSLPSLDFLLPDANYKRLPPGKKENPNLYTDWLIACFDLWFDQFAHIRIRFFDTILSSAVGISSKTDALGFGDVSLLTIETDGSYHDLDVLKVAYEGATNLGLTLSNNCIEEAVVSPQVETHRGLLKKDGLCVTCQQCDIVDICAGGTVPHRYSEKGFDNPSVYCQELYALISHAKKRLAEQLQCEVTANRNDSSLNYNFDELDQFENTSLSYPILKEMLTSLAHVQKEKFIRALIFSEHTAPDLSDCIRNLLSLPVEQLEFLSLQPSIYTWTNVINAAEEGAVITSIDGDSLRVDPDYALRFMDFLETPFNVQRINRYDYWLRAPFGNKIKYESMEAISLGNNVISEAYNLIAEWDSNLLEEIKLIAPEIQFIKDTTAHPEKIVSFSDNSVPGALYVTLLLGDKLISPADLADSILHEYRHQKLYLLQKISEVISIDVPLVNSPWREELRPPSGLYHAIYVFSFLRKFWNHLSIVSDEPLKSRATEEVKIISERIEKGTATVKETRLTPTGMRLLEILSNQRVHETT